MSPNPGTDCEIRHLANGLLTEHGAPADVAQILMDFAATCDQLGLERSAARFRAGACHVLTKHDCA